MQITLGDFAPFHALDATPVKYKEKNDKVLRPVHPNAGLEALYRKHLITLIDEMQASIDYWATASYRRAPPEIAQDELSSASMREAMRKLSRRWIGRFDEMAKELSVYFAKSVSNRTDAALKKILGEAGFTIDWKLTQAQRDVLNAIVHENVSLIRSIPRDHLQKVEGIVMRSVQAGHDLKQLSTDLREQFGVTKRRAKFISNDQTKKATAMLSRTRYIEVGIEEAIWVHSGGGNHPRPTHVKAGRERVKFNVAEGWFDPHEGQKIFPGTLPNCRCVMRPVLRGITKGK